MSNSIALADCNGLAGFMTLGLVQSGMNLVSRTGTLDFGNPFVEHVAKKTYVKTKSGQENENEIDEYSLIE